MYDDILGETELTDEECFQKIDHRVWCSLHCLEILNEMVGMGLMEMSDGGKPGMILTEKGLILIKKYWTDHIKREPNEEDVELGMGVLKEEGMW